MAKTVRLQVLMTFDQYTDIKKAANELKLPYKNDSQMFMSVIYLAVTEMNNLQATTYAMRLQITDLKKHIEQLIAQLDNQSKSYQELLKENEILQTNLEVKNVTHKKKKNIRKQ